MAQNAALICGRPKFALGTIWAVLKRVDIKRVDKIAATHIK